MSKEFYFFEQYSRSLNLHRTKRDWKDFNQALNHAKRALTINEQLSDSSSLIQQTIKVKKVISPESLTKQLDSLLQIFNQKIRQEDEENLPRVSLPAQLILQLHSTWSQLIEHSNHQYPIWRTKAGEERYLQTKDLPETVEEISLDKSVNHRRTSSRLSISSASTYSHRASISANPRARLTRSYSRTSSITTNHLRLIKTIQPTIDNPLEVLKNGIHVQFRLSTKDQLTNQQMLTFDVMKNNVENHEDRIVFLQNKCKQLLAETKRKIYETTAGLNGDSCRIRFYEENQSIRKRSAVSALNRRQKSKFALSILRHEIPEKFQLDLNTSDTKRKSSIEFPDGSTQIYYPSGRLCVLRLRSPKSNTLFFDDTDSSSQRFLGFVTSTGNVVLNEPSYHARFIGNNRHEKSYLCHGKTGVIEKEIQWNSSEISEGTFPPSIQLQINSFMQLEYHNPSNISFAFQCQNEHIEYQLGVHLLKQSSSTKQTSRGKISPMLVKRSNSVMSNSDNRSRKFSKEKSQTRPVTMMEELTVIRKRIEQICSSWLEECRRTLGILNIDAYHLPDLPPTTITEPQIIESNRSERKQHFVTDRFRRNVIAETIERYLPRSDAGHLIKQRIYQKNLLPNRIKLIK